MLSFRLLGHMGLVAVSLLLAACTPTFNWRALPTQDVPFRALMPCKPDEAERDVPLDGQSARLQMRSCDTGGMTFAVAWADVGDVARVAPALAGWRRATLLALQADTALADAAPQTARVPGANLALDLRAEGRNFRGEPTRMRAIHATRGSLIVQAAIYGGAIDDRVAVTFFEGLELP
jgi:hypothetical protein